MSLIGRGLAVPLTLTYTGFVRGLGASRTALRSFERSVNSTLRRMSTGFRRMTGVLNPIRAGLAGVALAVPLAMLEKLNRAMQQSTAIMGGVSDDMRAKMRQNAIDIAKTTVFQAHEAAQGYYFLASAGLDAQQSLAALPAVAEFAQAGMFDLTRATDLLLDAQTAMMLRSNDAATNLENLRRVSDALTMGNKLSTATVEQMAEGLSNGLGGALRLVNKDVEEGAALLTVFAERGTKGLAGGTAASIVIRDLQTKSIKFRDAFREAGIAVYDVHGQMRLIADIIGDMEQKLAGKSDRQKREFFMGLGFMDKSVRHMLDLLGTSEKLRHNMEVIKREGPGSTAQLAKDMLTPFQRSWNEFKGAFQQFAESLKPVLDMLTALLSGAAANLNTIAAQRFGGDLSQFIITAVGKIGDAIQAMVGAVMEMATSVMELIGGFRASAVGRSMGLGFEQQGHWKNPMAPKAWPFNTWVPKPGSTRADFDRRVAGMRSATNTYRGVGRFSDWMKGAMKPYAATGITSPLAGLGGIGRLIGTAAAPRAGTFSPGHPRGGNVGQRAARGILATLGGLGGAVGGLAGRIPGLRDPYNIAAQQAGRARGSQAAVAMPLAANIGRALGYALQGQFRTGYGQLRMPAMPAGLAGFGANMSWAWGAMQRMQQIGRPGLNTTPWSALDPASRAGNTQRVRALRATESDRVAKDQLKELAAIHRGIDEIKKNPTVKIEPSDLGGG